MYISDSDLVITEGKGPAARMIAGEPCEIPECLVEAALAAGVRPVGEKTPKKGKAKAEPVFELVDEISPEEVV